MPKVPTFGLYHAVLSPLTLVNIKRVLGVPLANEINERVAKLQRLKLTVNKFNCASSNTSSDFRRDSRSRGTSLSQNNGTVA
jgi:hypothetical protein